MPHPRWFLCGLPQASHTPSKELTSGFTAVTDQARKGLLILTSDFGFFSFLRVNAFCLFYFQK